MMEFDAILDNLQKSITGMGGNKQAQDILNEARKINKTANDIQSNTDKNYPVVIHRSKALGLKIEKVNAVWKRSKIDAFDSVEINAIDMTFFKGNEKTVIDYTKQIADLYN